MAELQLLATVDDLRLFLQNPDLDQDLAELALRFASGAVVFATGQTFAYVEDDEVVVNGYGTATLLLPQIPVTLVVSVSEAAGTASEAELDGPLAETPAYEWSEDGIVRRLSGLFARRYRWFRIVYDHGYEVTPDDVVGIVVRAAARGLSNPEGLRSESIGRYSYQADGSVAGSAGLTAGEVALLQEVYGTGQRRGIAGAGAAGSGS